MQERKERKEQERETSIAASKRRKTTREILACGFTVRAKILENGDFVPLRGGPRAIWAVDGLRAGIHAAGRSYKVPASKEGGRICWGLGGVAVASIVASGTAEGKVFWPRIRIPLEGTKGDAT